MSSDMVVYESNRRPRSQHGTAERAEDGLAMCGGDSVIVQCSNRPFRLLVMRRDPRFVRLVPIRMVPEEKGTGKHMSTGPHVKMSWSERSLIVWKLQDDCGRKDENRTRGIVAHSYTHQRIFCGLAVSYQAVRFGYVSRGTRAEIKVRPADIPPRTVAGMHRERGGKVCVSSANFNIPRPGLRTSHSPH